MSGNVWEWTNVIDEKYRVLRGGTWFYNAWVARCAGRLRFVPDYFHAGIGFRLVLSLASGEF